MPEWWGSAGLAVTIVSQQRASDHRAGHLELASATRRQGSVEQEGRARTA